MCVRESDGVKVSPGYCDTEGIATNRSCSILCPEDCILGRFSHLSVCASDCGLQATRHRSRIILSSGNHLGRRCPEPELLQQVSNT